MKSGEPGGFAARIGNMVFLRDFYFSCCGTSRNVVNAVKTASYSIAATASEPSSAPNAETAGRFPFLRPQFSEIMRQKEEAIRIDLI